VTELDEALTGLAHLAFSPAVTWQRDQPTLATSAPLTATTASEPHRITRTNDESVDPKSKTGIRPESEAIATKLREPSPHGHPRYRRLGFQLHQWFGLPNYDSIPFSTGAPIYTELNSQDSESLEQLAEAIVIPGIQSRRHLINILNKSNW
jgi:hypothetical protein